MSTILVIYHSQQYGDTEILAKAFAAGAREGGSKVLLVNTNEKRITLEEFLSADGIGLGTPDYYSDVAGTIKTFFDDLWFWDRSGEPVKEKPAAIFFSHGGGGRVRERLEYFSGRFFEQVGETVESRRPPSDEAKQACRELGKKLAATLK